VPIEHITTIDGVVVRDVTSEAVKILERGMLVAESGAHRYAIAR
jgi:hypothetical protein